MKNAYQLSNISFTYDKSAILSIDKLNIRANKITALIGPNGCGKSTLLNLLAFLQKKQQGQINFFSEPTSKQNTHDFIKRIAFLPQKPYMLRGSVADNLSAPLKFHQLNQNRPNKIQAALEQMGVAHLSQQQAKTLSGGEQQKVALARAIITDPDVLLMDEPFSYLDHSSQQLLENFITHFVKERHKTLIFSTHNRLQGIALADDVISLVQGKVTSSPLINLFHGSINNQLFDTGKIKIMLADNAQDYQHASIDPNEIVLSATALVSSMRNQYQGKVTAIADEMGKIRVSVLAGELFQVMITLNALKELNISIGDQLWVNFKSNSVLMF
jgi:tungstate transport system ATP-binding protein